MIKFPSFKNLENLENLKKLSKYFECQIIQKNRNKK